VLSPASLMSAIRTEAPSQSMRIVVSSPMPLITHY
jgi:hypothetical protein